MSTPFPTLAMQEMPNIAGWGGHTFDLKTMACSYDRLAAVSYTVFFCGMAIVCPLFIVLVSYLKIFLYVRTTRQNLNNLTGRNGTESSYQKRQRDEIQLAKTLFIVFLIFTLCWSPYVIVVMVDQNDQWSKVVYVIVIQLAHSNSSLNSIVYAACNRCFRRAYKQFVLSIDTMPLHIIKISDIE